MKFGPVPASASIGAISAHALRRDGLHIKKGQRIGETERAALLAAGVETLIAAELEPGDVGEDVAAATLAARLAGAHLRRESPFTGRVNVFATINGLLRVDRAAIDRVNRIDESITAATLAENAPVVAGDMAATVKIIPFATSGGALEAACAAIGEAGSVHVAPYRPLRFVVISTLLPGLKPSVIAKTLGALERRLEPARAEIVRDVRVAHEPGALATALRENTAVCDAVIVFGASAITDRRDVIPEAIEACGGRIEHFGMPVDPGNLLLLAEIDGRPVLGAPGCARSPKENGFDWVLARILADVPTTRADIQAMGVGGLLMEIETRPQPRRGDE